MKPVCIQIFLVTIMSASAHLELFAQENDGREVNLNEYAEGHDYSFEDDYQSQKARKIIPWVNSFRSDNADLTGKIQNTAFSNINFLGPANCASRTRAILVDKLDMNLIFAGSTSGGLFRSTDQAATWTPVNDQTIGLNVTCITQNPLNPDIIYYGTGEHKNRKIRDLGSGIYKSTDHGLTFAQLPATANSSFQLINSVNHSLVDSNTIYVGTRFNGLYRTTDAGATFQTIFVNGKNITDIECFANGKVMITASFDGIYYSATGDSGTFTKATGTPASGFSRIEMAYCDDFPSVGYSIFADSIQGLASSLIGVYRSSDGGVSWTAVTNPENVSYFPYGDFILAIGVKPDDPDYVFCGGGKLAFSTDGGQSWTKPAYNGPDQHVILFDKFNTNLLYNGNDQGIWRFDLNNPPIEAANLDDTYNASQIWAGSYFPTGNNCLIGAQDNVLLKNTNDDSMFVRMTTYTIDGNFTHVNQQDPDVSYISGNFAEIFRSNSTSDSLPLYTLILNELDTNSDGVVDDNTWHVNPIEMNYLDGTQLYIPTVDRIWRTTNSGDNWTPITNPFTTGNKKPFALGLSNAVQPVVYAGGVKGCFLRMDNAYTTVPGQEVDLSASVPAPLVADGKITCLAVFPLDNTTLYATIEDDDTVSKIWKITAGNTATPVWTDISGNMDKNIDVYWIEFDPDHADSVLFIGTAYGLYSTVDAGTTWFRETSIPLITVFQMRLRRSDKKLFVFTFGRGVWVAQLPGGNIGIDSPGVDYNFNVFPNPSHGKFNLDVLNKDIAINDIVINDMRGRMIKELNYGGKKVSKTYIDLSKEAKGIYFIDIKTNLGEFRKKLVKL